MAGCFGNHPEDRAREKELDRYLNSLIEDDEIEKDYEYDNGEYDDEKWAEQDKNS